MLERTFLRLAMSPPRWLRAPAPARSCVRSVGTPMCTARAPTPSRGMTTTAPGKAVAMGPVVV